jgi:hypothetical protein
MKGADKLVEKILLSFAHLYANSSYDSGQAVKTNPVE